MKKSLYKISMIFGDKVSEGKGETALEALQAIPNPIKITTKMLLKIKNGKRQWEGMFMPHRARRFFQPLAQKVLSNQLEYLMR